ncbi:hypothetical protein [Leptolyngbya sp. FACHB-17]|nr:hypothetical protein [Leptolyngbya sp. FACHB-17]
MTTCLYRMADLIEQYFSSIELWRLMRQLGKLNDRLWKLKG